MNKIQNTNALRYLHFVVINDKFRFLRISRSLSILWYSITLHIFHWCIRRKKTTWKYSLFEMMPANWNSATRGQRKKLNHSRRCLFCCPRIMMRHVCKLRFVKARHSEFPNLHYAVRSLCFGDCLHICAISETNISLIYIVNVLCLPRTLQFLAFAVTSYTSNDTNSFVSLFFISILILELKKNLN